MMRQREFLAMLVDARDVVLDTTLLMQREWFSQILAGEKTGKQTRQDERKERRGEKRKRR
jgi:hypothetical protein